MRLLKAARSLKARLAAIFFLGLLVILFVAGGFILDEQEHSLLHNIDTSLDTRADDIVALLEQDTPPAALGINRDEDTLAVVLDVTGSLITSTDRFGDPAELQRAVGEPTDRGRTVALPSFDETRGVERMRAVHLIGPNGESVFVAQSLERLDQSIADLQTDLLIVGLSLAVAAGALCWFVVWRALRPVGLIVGQAAEIRLASLDRRLPEPKRNDEIGELTTTLNAMLARLQASADQQRQLVADVAHELRSPLTAIATQLEVDLTHPEQADWPGTAGEALDEARRLQGVINDLLLLAQLEDEDRRHDHRLVDLDDIVLTTIARLAPTTETPIDHAAVSAGLVRGNPGQLERCVQNLLDNAIRHAADRVVVTLAEDADAVVLSVSDDGSGVPAEQAEKIFQRFYRVQHARDRNSGGTGLGLAIARETVEAHGGTIALSGGSGSTFVVTLPTAQQ